MDATVLTVAFLMFADIFPQALATTPMSASTAATRKKEVDVSFWLCLDVWHVAPVAAVYNLPVEQPLWNPTECTLHES